MIVVIFDIIGITSYDNTKLLLKKELQLNTDFYWFMDKFLLNVSNFDYYSEKIKISKVLINQKIFRRYNGKADFQIWDYELR